MRQYQLLILVLLAVILGAYQNCGKMPSSQIGTNEFGDIGGDFSDGIGLEPVGIAPGGDGTDNPGDSDGSGLVFQANCVYDRNTPIMFFLLFYDAKTKLTRWDIKFDKKKFIDLASMGTVLDKQNPIAIQIDTKELGISGELPMSPSNPRTEMLLYQLEGESFDEVKFICEAIALKSPKESNF